MMTVDTPANEVRIERSGTLPLVFDGWLIAQADSLKRPRKLSPDSKNRTVPSRPPSRWTEVRIWRTTTDKWVTVTVGRSNRPNEVDLIRATVCDNPVCVQDSVRVQPSGVITATAAEALRQAAEADPRLAGVLEERI